MKAGVAVVAILAIGVGVLWVASPWRHTATDPVHVCEAVDPDPLRGLGLREQEPSSRTYREGLPA